MRSRLFLNFILAAIVLGLAVFVYFKNQQPDAPAATTLTALDESSIERLIYQTGDDERVHLNRKDGHWHLLSPLTMAADDLRVAAILRLAKAESLARYPAQQVNAEQSGLDHPLFQVWLNDTEIRFGGTEPQHSRRYVQVGDTVHLITDTFSFRLQGGPATLVETTLLPAGDIEELALPEVRVYRADGKWQTDPVRAEISADALQSLVTAWDDAQALRVELITPGLPTSQTVTVKLGNPEQAVQFKAGEQNGDAILVRPDLGIQYVLSHTLYQRLTTLDAPDAGAE